MFGCLVGGVSDPTVEGCDGVSWLERPASPDPSPEAPDVAAGPPPNPLRGNVTVCASLLQAESSSVTANEVASSTPLMLGASVNVSKGMSNRGYSTNLEYAMRAAHSTIRLCLAPGFVEVHEPQWGSGYTGKYWRRAWAGLRDLCIQLGRCAAYAVVDSPFRSPRYQ